MKKETAITLAISFFFFACSKESEKGLSEWIGASCYPGWGTPERSLKECYDDQYLLVCDDGSWTIYAVDCFDYCVSFGAYEGHCSRYLAGHHCACKCNRDYFWNYCLDEKIYVYCNDMGYVRFHDCEERWCDEMNGFCKSER